MTEQFWDFWGDEQVQLPIGGETFAPTGFIGPITAKALYSFYSTVDLADQTFEAPPPFYRRKTKNGFLYYYLKQDEAQAAVKAADGNIAPTQQWVFQIKTKHVLNTLDVEKLAHGEDGTGGFGDVISLSCQIATYRSMKHRHEFHLITLPAAVYAIAKANKYDVPEMDFSRLVGKVLSGEDSNTNGVRISDEFQREMIGDPEEKNMRIIMAESVLGRQRTALWKALGEDDPLKYTTDGKNSKGEPWEWNTTATKLGNCLGVANKAWNGAVWGRLVMVVDPRVNSMGEGRQLSLPAMVEVFKTEAQAREAAKADLDRMQAAQDKKALQQDMVDIPIEHPPLPAAWAELNTTDKPNDGIVSWLAMIKSVKTEHPEIDQAKNKMMLKNVLKKVVDPEYIFATLEEFEAWLPLVK